MEKNKRLGIISLACIVTFLGMTQGILTSVTGLCFCLFCAGVYGLITGRTIFGIGFLVKLAIENGNTAKQTFQKIVTVSSVVFVACWYALKWNSFLPL